VVNRFIVPNVWPPSMTMTQAPAPAYSQGYNPHGAPPPYVPPPPQWPPPPTPSA
jgi:hypothetical protein